MFFKWGEFSYAHRRIIPVIIIAGILALFGVFGTQLDDRMSQEGWDDPNSQSTAAAKLELEKFGRDNNGDVIILVDNPEENFAAAGEYLRQLQLKHPDQISHVASYFDKRNPNFMSQDGSVAFAAIGLKGDDEQTLKDFRIIKDDLHAADFPVQIGGATAVADALDEGMAGDIARAERAALPLVGLLLLVVSAPWWRRSCRSSWACSPSWAPWASWPSWPGSCRSTPSPKRWSRSWVWAWPSTTACSWSPASVRN